MLMYDTVLFDLDGTLTDPYEGIANAVTYAMRRIGRADPSASELKAFIGPPIFDSFFKMCGGDGNAVDRAVFYYREYYMDKGKFENKVYDGVIDMLDKLKSQGITLAVATSKPEAVSVEILERFRLANSFDVIAGASLDKSRAEKSKVIEYALDMCGVRDKSRVIMVGDRKYDVIGAKNNGLGCIGVLYGYGDRAELSEAGADFIVTTPQGVADIVLSDN